MKVLSRERLDQVVDRLVGALHPERIHLFGSHAYGVPHARSDLDLLVVVPDSDQPQYRRAMDAYRALTGLMVPIDVVVFTRDEMDRRGSVVCSLAHTVLSKGRLIYAA